MTFKITFDERTFRIIFYSCYLALAFALACVILSASTMGPGQGNLNELSVTGEGNFQTSTRSTAGSDYASVVGAGIDYRSRREWGTSGQPEKFTSSFMIASATPDGKWRNAYRVQGAGAEHKVSFQATKIAGDAEFASEITLEATEAGDQNFDSQIKFDTRDGNATIMGRVYNQIAGRPATLQELDAVGRFLLEHHLNISLPAITPENWLGSCSELNRDMILDKSVPTGIYIAPVGYYVDDAGQLRRNATAAG